MNDPVIDDIKQRLDIVDVIGRYVTLKRSGANFKSPCPFHAEKTPSFMVNRERQLYRCFGCGESGDVFAFIMKQENIDFGSALRLLAGQAGVTLPEKTSRPSGGPSKETLFEANALAAQFFHQVLVNHPSGKASLDYLLKRGVTLDSVKTFSIGFAPVSDAAIKSLFQKKSMSDALLRQAGNPERFRNRIMFPFRDVIARVVGFSGRAMGEVQPKYLNTSETALFHKNRFIYGLYEAKKAIGEAEKIVLVEGQLDLVMAHQAGTTYTVATSGTALTTDHLTILRRYSDRLLLAFDGDAAGQKAIDRAIQLALGHEFEVLVIDIPAGQDPADIIARDPKEWASRLAKPLTAIDWLFRYYFPGSDNTMSSTDRDKVFQAIFPYISLLQDSVSRTYAIQRLGLLLGIKNEKAVSEAFDEWQKKTPSASVVTQGSTPDVSPSAPPDEWQKKERSLIGLLLLHPHVLEHKELYLAPEDFTNLALKGLYTTIQNCYTKTTTQSDLSTFIPNVSATLDSTATKAFEKLLFDTQTALADFSTEQIIHEYTILVRAIRSRRQEARMHTFAQRIAEAESQHDRKRVLELMNEMQTVLKKEPHA